MDDSAPSPQVPRGSAEPRATPAGRITIAAIGLFAALLGATGATLLQRAFGSGGRVDDLMVLALLLNVVLILVGWRRHQQIAQLVGQRLANGARTRLTPTSDPLTGLLNRRALTEQGSAMLLDATRRHRAAAMLLVDLDRFRPVNELHGHAMGDKLLARVASHIQAELPPFALAGRLGGDEFACAFVFDPRDPDTVQRIAERLVSRLAQPFEIDGVAIQITATIGLARSDVERGSIDALMRAAEIAMCAAKEAGRNRAGWFEPAMARALHARNELENGLRQAIPAGQIVPYFEQQIDLATGQLFGFEVLARWEHPLHGVIPPERFITIAEQSGMIADLSLSLMRHAFHAARDWDSSLSLSINISPAQLRDAWLPQKIIKLLLETGFPAHRLEIEITEGALFENLPLAQSIVGSLKNQGIRVALDDFGTGHSSLGHLRALPFDRIKIDRSVVKSVAGHSDSAAVVGAIAGLGASLNLPVTAEGVEDIETEGWLRNLGCARGQGYLYGRPMNSANTRRLLAERRLLVPGAPLLDPDHRLAS
ncbi:EAL domain-containing protein [Sphingomonas sp.]|jgi:diguanylate cyclase (GGDEF)-like protein|uniref:putative bifunctional diguanylate cyclase/phosphodiesterase n=1 Tax=Sphingomonas sp. TaxID=28214 RepID=UPI00261B1F2E|nr:EAL domain-containing protein [Sphingomonas sp.]MDF2496310.1 GGDEF-domain containing protein [Sphingomonas sp.]